MKRICELYSELQNKDSTKNGFTPVTKIIASDKFFLGISEEKTPMFLIDSEFESAIADSELEYISVLFNKNCKIIDDANKEFSKTCSIIILNSDNYDFQNYFLEVMYLMLQNIPQNPTSSQLKTEIDKIIKLFSCMSKPAVKTIQGLWAELLVIEQSANPEYLIKAWHSSPKSKFDFDDGSDKIEVKSTSKTERIHSFALEQLSPNRNSNLVIVSVFTHQTGIGKNINDLRQQILLRINDMQVQALFDSMIFQTLGNELESAFGFCYDYQLALDELKFYNAYLIPKINAGSIPPEISDVHFSCNLSNVPFIEKTELQQTKSNLLRSL